MDKLLRGWLSFWDLVSGGWSIEAILQMNDATIDQLAAVKMTESISCVKLE